MEKPGGHQQQQQVALKCPRCDSSNTKFCYYNNYSLSQPRHFCKACKRYWTRGGTLRNVPVGGGCRKNKHHRLKRPSTTTIDSSSAPPQSQLHQIDAASSNHHHHHHINPLFYGLAAAASNPCCDVNNFPFSSRLISTSSRIIPSSSSSGLFDLIQPQMNALGLGCSSGVMPSDNGLFIRNNGFTSNNSNDNSNTLFPSYSSIFSSSACSSTSNSATSPVMMPNNSSSVLGSSIMMMQQQQQKEISGVKDDGPGGRNITSFHEGLVEVTPQMGIRGDDDDLHGHGHGHGGGGGVVGASKDVKVELGQNRLLEFWNTAGSDATDNFQNQQIQQHVNVMTMPDPNSNSLYWNSTAAAAALGGSNWNDQPNNIGPSLTSLI